MEILHGKYRFKINMRLLAEQQAVENIEEIIKKHKERIDLFSFMEVEDNLTLLRKYDDLCTFLEYELQRLWKFPEDARYHRFWERPKCTCPKMDNMDSYPYMFYINGNCPLHGRKDG